MDIFSQDIKYIFKIILIYFLEICKVVSSSTFYLQKLHIFSREIKYRYIDIFSQEVKHGCIDVFSRDIKYRCRNIFLQEVKDIFKITSIYFLNVSKVVSLSIFYVQKLPKFSQETKYIYIDIFLRDLKYRYADVSLREIKYRCIDIF